MIKHATLMLATLSFFLAPPVAAAQETLHPAFTFTEEQVHRAFADYENKGKRHEKVIIGEEHVVSVPAVGPLGNRESLKMSVVFMSPLWQARKSGYEFGIVARSRTDADRKDFIRAVINRLNRRSDVAYFEVTLEPPKDSNIGPPQVSFALLSRSGDRIEPSVRPQFVFPGRDILADRVEPLSFRVGSAASPLITNKLDKMVVVVDPGDGERRLEFNLNR